MKIILLDSNSLINRAFYAVAPLTTSYGLYTNAILGYINMLQKLILEEKPTHICAVFDCRAKTFRHEKYAEYKANRKGMPEELAQQIPVLKELLTEMGIKVFFQEGFEADDIVGSLAKKFDIPTIIVSGDKDCLQLVDDTTTVYHTKRGVSDVVKYTPERLLEDGMTPQLVIEYKGLAGDSSDNIPGAKGVGDKTAKSLLQSYGNIDGIYENIENVKGKLKDRLIESKELVYLSKDLATINTMMTINEPLESFVINYPLPDSARKMMQKLEFSKVIGRFTFENAVDNEELATESIDKINTLDNSNNIEEIKYNIVEVDNVTDLENEVNKIPKGTDVCIDFDENLTIAYNETTISAVVSDNLLGLGLTEEDAYTAIKSLFSSDFTTIMFDVKDKMAYLDYYDIKVEKPYEDVLLKAYLYNCNKVIKDKKVLLSDYGYDAKNIAGELKNIDMVLSKKLEDKSLNELYYNLELPLIECLFSMEKVGFKLDTDMLHKLSNIYDKEITNLIEEIYKVAGQNFNVNSNKQLGEILFEKLNIPGGKKNKTGYKVGAEILAEIDHPIVELLLRYRTITKLKSTYIDGMYSVMDMLSNRVHTVFKQCLTQTGRLSSTEPNLQNIPVRTNEGREIRKMFIPSDNCILVSADYSQIELRLLAHFSQEEKLVKAYNNNDDIHAITAHKVFKVPLEDVDSILRSKAKAVNFGIIYGISSFGLSKNANVPVFQAKQFITDYFLTYPKVKEYMDNNVKLAKRDGYLSTLLGRLRYFPELSSSKFNERAFGERAAMNMPLQGSASDIIKVAMLKVSSALKEKSLKAKLILQIHDELIIDTPIEEVEIVKNLIKDCMESAVNLTVPLTVNVATGYNWYEAK